MNLSTIFLKPYWKFVFTEHSLHWGHFLYEHRCAAEMDLLFQLSNISLAHKFPTSMYQWVEIFKLCYNRSYFYKPCGFSIAKTKSSIIYLCVFILDFNLNISMVTNNWISYEWVWFLYFEYINGYEIHAKGIFEWGVFFKLQ